MYIPSFAEFNRYVKYGNLIPVYREIVADTETPVSAYQKISKNSNYSFLLESVEGGERFARYSFLGTSPYLVFKSKGKEAEFIEGKKKGKFTIEKNPLLSIKEKLSKYLPVKIGDMPIFSGGAVGYIGYDVVRFFEKIPDNNIDDLNLPDCYFIFVDTVLVFDHLKHKIKIISFAYLKEKTKKEIKLSYEKAVEKIENLIKILKKNILQKERPKKENFKIKISSNLKKSEFEKMVRKVKEYIFSGDIVQAVISQRFSLKINCPNFDIYRALRITNPSPYLYYLSFPDVKIIGSSPELLVRLDNKIVETRPIAGTRKRGKNEKEDKKIMEELLNDEKEKAEHIMLVDLGRNDLGRICKYGTVEVNEFMKIEKYSQVMHIVSNVRGEIKKNEDAYTVISSCFPAGTVSGAPKIRAMEIIDEVEKNKRGPYAGAVGYFDFFGNMDTAINIRTIVLKDNIAYIQAGAGIVADSKPEKEYQETINKAKALFKAIELAERGLE
jgi:anthranilate synthase component 1